MAGTPIVNSNAVDTWGNTYNICDFSGFKAKPGELIPTWSGLMVLPEYWEPRNAQDFVRVRAEHLEGSPRPEGADKFITTRVLATDL